MDSLGQAFAIILGFGAIVGVVTLYCKISLWWEFKRKK
jgi:hypothetical protein